MQVEKLGEGGRDRLGAVGCLRPIVETPMSDDVEIDLLVRAGEDARAERRDERDRVRGVVDRREQVRQVLDLLPGEETTTALDAVRDLLAAKRGLELLDPGAGGEEDRDVAERRRSLLAGSSRRVPATPRRLRVGSRRRSGWPRSHAPRRPSRRARRGSRRSSGSRRRARCRSRRAACSQAARPVTQRARGRRPR